MVDIVWMAQAMVDMVWMEQSMVWVVQYMVDKIWVEFYCVGSIDGRVHGFVLDNIVWIVLMVEWYS